MQQDAYKIITHLINFILKLIKTLKLFITITLTKVLGSGTDLEVFRYISKNNI